MEYGESGHQTRHFLILNALYYRTTRCGASMAVRCGASRRTTLSTAITDRADLKLLLEGMLTVFDLIP
jgi:hypothetical protein